MIIDCISDLHGFYPELGGGDLLIVGGDLTKNDSFEAHCSFISWFHEEAQKYKKCVVISGNHDGHLVGIDPTALYFSTWNSRTNEQNSYSEHLCDSGTEYEGLKIWGSPWTLKFPGMNPACMAFTVDTEEELADKWALIPSDTDILITHSPPYGLLDEVKDWYTGDIRNVGSASLYEELYQGRLKPKLHVFGHIHEGYGHIPKMLDMPGVQFVNASYVNELYKPVNKPFRIIL
jgi:Icc-related predicted phosphoesterase